MLSERLRRRVEERAARQFAPAFPGPPLDSHTYPNVTSVVDENIRTRMILETGCVRRLETRSLLSRPEDRRTFHLGGIDARTLLGSEAAGIGFCILEAPIKGRTRRRAIAHAPQRGRLLVCGHRRLRRPDRHRRWRVVRALWFWHPAACPTPTGTPVRHPLFTWKFVGRVASSAMSKNWTGSFPTPVGTCWTR